MGTTADKLQNILNAKNAIKKKFSIGDDVKFIDYADNININSGSGNSTEFYKCIETRALSCAVYGLGAANGFYRPVHNAVEGLPARWMQDTTASPYYMIESIEGAFQIFRMPEREAVYYAVKGGVDYPWEVESWTDGINVTKNQIIRMEGNSTFVISPVIRDESTGNYSVDTKNKYIRDILSYRNYFIPVAGGIYSNSGDISVAQMYPDLVGVTVPEYFKCVAVGANGDSSSSGNSTDIIVSGGTGNYEELNGTYKLDDPTATGLNRYWKHSADNKWQIYCTDMLGTWEFRKGDKASGSVSVVGPIYYGDENSQPIGENWNTAGDEIDGDSTLKTEWASAEPELVPNTWNGQKAIRMTDAETGKPYYDFEETVTEGLTFGNGFTPVKDGVYDREALVKVNLFEKVTIPQEGLVLKADLTSGLDSDIALSGLPEFKEIQGRQCAYMNGTTCVRNDSFNAGNQFTVSFAVCGNPFKQGDPLLGIGVCKNYSCIEILMNYNNQYPAIYLKSGYNDDAEECGTNIETGWHHLILTWDGELAKLYVDNALSGTHSWSGFNLANGIALGANYNTSGQVSRHSYTTAGYQLWRVYNRVLTDDERTLLYQEFAK